MAYETKELSGALFKNKRKEKDSHPDYTGTCVINGVEYWMSAWINTPKSNPTGEKYMSMQFKVKEDKPQTAKPAPKSNDNFGNSDVPF